MYQHIIEDELFKIIKEAEKGLIHVGNNRFYMKFYTKIEDKFNNIIDSDTPVLNIQNCQSTLIILSEYINMMLTSNNIWTGYQATRDDVRIFIKKHIVTLFANATKEDLSNPISFIQRYIDFAIDTTFSTEKIENIFIESLGLYLSVNRELQPMGQETPYALHIKLHGELENIEFNYQLPYVRYGVTTNNDEKVLYLYAIQNRLVNNINNEELQTKFNKKVNRKLYKLNKNVPDDIDGLLEISPSFLLAETILVALMRNENIDKMIIVKELPEKIYLKEQLFQDQTKYQHLSRKKLEALGVITNVDRLKHSLTDRFLKVTKRLQYHMGGVHTISDGESFKEVFIDYDKNDINNVILEEVYEKCKIDFQKHK